MRLSGAPAAGVAALLSSVGGCVTIQAVEPVISPPEKFRFDTITQVEFVAPVMIGARCAERGAKFMGLAGLNSGACADAYLISMIDPCQTLTAGPYAHSLCANVNKQAVTAKASQQSAHGGRAVAMTGAFPDLRSLPSQDRAWRRVRTIEFVSILAINQRCANRDPEIAEAAIVSCSDGESLVLTNPCELYTSGWYERAFCHELAHVNGWAPDHLGGEARPALRLASESPQALAAVAQKKVAFAGR